MFSVSSTTITNWENSKSFPSMNVILYIEQISKTELKKLLFKK
jgi:transcriptional regulator with XRE-family HTH domain